MNIILFTRGIPSKYHPQWGCFEKDQAEALAAYGHKVVCISFDARFKSHRGKLGLHHYENINGVEYYNYVLPPKVIFPKFINYSKHFINPALNKIYSLIEKRNGKPDIIYSQFFQNAILGINLSKHLKIPVVYIEHLAKFNNPNIKNTDLHKEKFACLNCNSLITVSQNLGNALKNLFNVDFKVVNNLYGTEFGKKPTFLTKNNIFTIVSSGSLVYRKGFDLLIKSLSQVSIPRDKWKLNIIGWGEERKNLEHLIKEKNLQNNVFLLGKMDKNQIANQLSKSDVFVLPSRNENFSVSILEGLSMGLPVIATDCGGIRECINDNNGIIVPVDNMEALTHALEYIYENYHKFNKMAIYEDCNLRFSPSAIAYKLTQIFEETIEKYKNQL